MCAEAICIVSGGVQRVGFRDFVADAARTQGVVGTVRNCPDGTVEVVAQGTPEKVRTLIAALHKGPPLARVVSVAVVWRTPAQLFDDFRVLH